MSKTVYHGSNVSRERPNCGVGRKAVDFGSGFYVTTVYKQAIEWTKRVADNKGGEPVLNIYNLERDGFLNEGKGKIFPVYNEDWLEFVVKNRLGKEVEEYDFIEGGVADDRIIDTVKLYILGFCHST